MVTSISHIYSKHLSQILMNATLQMEGVNKCAQTSWVASTAAVTTATSCSKMDQVAMVRVILFNTLTFLTRFKSDTTKNECKHKKPHFYIVSH